MIAPRRPPAAEGEIVRQVDRAMQECLAVPWDSPSLGYPGTSPSPIGVEVAQRYAGINSNNIGNHSLPVTRLDGTEAEHGFSGTQRLERESIAMLAEMCGGEPDSTAGYICEGGTLANLAGLWTGRNYLRSHLQGADRYQWSVKTALVTTPLAHYSLVKAADVLGIPTPPDADLNVPFGYQHVGCEDSGAMDVGQLKDKLTWLAERGTRHVVIVATAGTTMSGSVDDTAAIHAVRRELEEKLGITTYLHVDAAFGGFVLPFLDPPVAFGFDCGADSITIDPHKMGGVGFGCGVLLYRHEYCRYTETSAPYINSEVDRTIQGSRSGLTAASLWAVLKGNGYEGYRSIVDRCISRRDEAAMMLQVVPWATVKVGRTNQICWLLRQSAPTDKIKERLCGHPYYLHIAEYPIDPSDPRSKGRPAMKLIFMPHFSSEHLFNFIQEVRGL